MKSVYNKAKKTVADANIIVNGLAEGSDTREQNSAIADRIDHMIVEILPRGLRYCCLSCAEFLGRGDPGCCCGSGLYGPLRLLFGPLLYGVLFVPFVFAVLQQSARNQVAVDAFTAEGELSASSWYAAFLFLGAVSLYVLIAFTSLPPYDPRSARLLLLLSAVILVVWIQQALTFRYIMMRPELSRLKKQRGEKHKYRLCGRAYSSLNPHNMINYIYLTVILSEFFILASVCFHSNIPWKQYGARTSDNDIADFLQAVLPQALVGAFLDGASNTWLVVLVSYCAAYVMATGWVVYTRKSPASLSMAFVCDGLAGALYTTVVGRLLLSAFNLENNDFGRVLAMLGFFGFSTTAVFVATMRGDAGDARNTKRQSDVRFLPKWLAAERILKGLVGISAALLGNLKLELPEISVNGTAVGGGLLDSGIGSTRFIERTLKPKIGPILFVMFAIAVTIMHLVLLHRWHPTCSVTFVTRARTALLNVALAGQVITLSMLLMPWHGWLMLLIVVWMLAFLGLVSYAIFKVFFAPVSDDESEEMRRRRIKDVQDKMLRKGANVRGRGAGSLNIALPVNLRVGQPAPPTEARALQKQESMSILRGPPV